MSQVITPNWTDAVVVVAPQKIAAAAASVRGTIDLRGKFGARLFCKLGRLTTTVLAASVNVYVRPVLNNDVAGGMSGNVAGALHPIGPQFQSQIAVTVCPTVATTAAAGDKTLVLSSGTSMAEADVICISDSGGTTFTRTEFNIVSKVVSATLTLANGLEYAHTSGQADIVSRLADVFGAIPLPGGALWEVIFDYSRSATGGDIVVMAHAQRYDSNTAT
jgi:hypothetical protein